MAAHKISTINSQKLSNIPSLRNEYDKKQLCTVLSIYACVSNMHLRCCFLLIMLTMATQVVCSSNESLDKGIGVFRLLPTLKENRRLFRVKSTWF